MRLSIVIIRTALLYPYISALCADLYVIGESQSLRRGLTAYRYGIASYIVSHYFLYCKYNPHMS